MWKHELLQKAPLCPGEFAPHAPGMLYHFIKASTAFYFGDIKDFEQIRQSLLGQFHLMPSPPFSTTLIEYSVSDPSKFSEGQPEISSKRANLYCEREGERIFISLYYVDRFKSWMLCPVFVSGRIDKETKKINVGFKSFLKNQEMLKDSYFADIQDELANTGLLLYVLNTKNIVTKLVVPPERLNKARIRKKKEPLYSYHILEVVKGIPKTKYQGEVPWDYRSPANTALHLCRGHFKTYTEDAPLFGKYSGTFWWQPSIRGNAENGIVDKDYSVKVANA